MPKWDERLPASPVDPDAFLYMGADPCWTPDREYRTPAEAEGECLLCGGVGTILADDAGDPILAPDGSLVVRREIEPGSRRICARCFRSGRDPLPVVNPHDGPDPGAFVAAEPGYVTRDGVTIPERYAGLAKG